MARRTVNRFLSFAVVSSVAISFERLAIYGHLLAFSFTSWKKPKFAADLRFEKSVHEAAPSLSLCCGANGVFCRGERIHSCWPRVLISAPFAAR